MKTENDFTIIFHRFGSLSDGTKGSINELILLYLENMSVHLAELARAVKAADQKNMERIAHTACGLNETIGIYSLGSLFRNLESSAHTGQFSSIENTLKEISDEFELVRERFRGYAESLMASPPDTGDGNAS